mmetsp:Transcript_2111/g.4649  ORF Transcript_2111/g.4649 Transcript_2111/m.4649 type:complete len:201 (+) Transcript_2111:452-1054(+)
MVDLHRERRPQGSNVDGLPQDGAARVHDGQAAAFRAGARWDPPLLEEDPEVVGEHVRGGLGVGDEPPAPAQWRHGPAELAAAAVGKELLRRLREGHVLADGREVELVLVVALHAVAPDAREASRRRIRRDVALRAALLAAAVAPTSEDRLRAGVPALGEAVEDQVLGVVVAEVRHQEGVRGGVVGDHLLAGVGRPPILPL